MFEISKKKSRTFGQKAIGYSASIENICTVYNLAYESHKETKVNVVITTISPSGFSSFKYFTQPHRASSHRSLVFVLFSIPVVEDPCLLGQCRGRLVVPRGPSK